MSKTWLHCVCVCYTAYRSLCRSPALSGHRTVNGTDLAPDGNVPERSGWVGMLKQNGQGWDEVGAEGTRRRLLTPPGGQRGLSGEGRRLTDEREPGPGRAGKNRAGRGTDSAKGPRSKDGMFGSHQRGQCGSQQRGQGRGAVWQIGYSRGRRAETRSVDFFLCVMGVIAGL